MLLALALLVPVLALVALVAMQIARLRRAEAEAARAPGPYHVVYGRTGKTDSLPAQLGRQATVRLSVVVPAYNEEERIPIMLRETCDFLRARKQRDPTQTYEVIVVDDGSRDRTTETVCKFAKENNEDILIVRVSPNGGKGNAVRTGAMVALGHNILMVDADGATRFSDLEKLEAQIQRHAAGAGDNTLCLAIGSRAHMVKDAVAKRKWYRNLPMFVFHLLVRVVGGIRDVRDTQCGFKLATRRAARVIYPSLHIKRWGFDMEMIRTAHAYGIPVVEVPVNWTEIAGSKLSIVSASISMFMDVLKIRTAYMTGLWRMHDMPVQSN